MVRYIPIFFLFSLIWASVAFTDPSFHIQLGSQAFLLDEEPSIQLHHLKGSQLVTLTAEMTDAEGYLWESTATFEADDQGVVDLSKQAPMQGSYQEVDPWGLFWSMQPQKKRPHFFWHKENVIPVTLRLISEDGKIDHAQLNWLQKDPNIRAIRVQKPGLFGVLFLPPSSKPVPVIISFSGSGGGLAKNRAQLLASHGFAVLSLGYFAVPGLAKKFENIPLEIFERAIQWLRKEPKVDLSRVGLLGTSRGGELVLILGTFFPESIKAIVSIVPSSFIYAGFNQTPVSAWSYRQKPIGPFALLPNMKLDDKVGSSFSSPICMRPYFLKEIEKGMPSLQTCQIPVEKIQSPLLVISAGDDQMWPSTEFAFHIKKRLEDKKSSIIFRHLDYPKAGHNITLPNLPNPSLVIYHPTTQRWFCTGGSPLENQRANQDSWKQLIHFFHEHLQ